MVGAARRRGLEGVEHRVMDMQQLDLDDASVDVVVCRSGLMLVPEPARALREIRRVLRPGGRLAFSTWAAAKRNPWATAYGPVLIERGIVEPPKPGEPNQFALGEPDDIEPLVRGAGFEEVGIREVAVEFRFDRWEDYSRHLTALAAMLRQTLAQLDDSVRGEVEEAAKARLERFRGDDGYVLPGVALVTRAS